MEAGRPSIIASSPIFQPAVDSSTVLPDEWNEIPEVELSSSVPPSVVTPILRSYVPLSTPVSISVRPSLVVDPGTDDDLYAMPEVILSTRVPDSGLGFDEDDLISPSVSFTPIESSTIVTGPLDSENEVDLDEEIKPTSTLVVDFPSVVVPESSSPESPPAPDVEQGPEGKKNRPPSVNVRLPKQAVMAGNVFQ